MTDDEGVLLTPRQKAYLDANPEASLAEGVNGDSGHTQLRGVGGWLAFLTFSLLLLGPLVTILMTLAEQEQARQVNPEIVDTPLWNHVLLVDWGASFLYCLISIFAGFRLWKYWRPSTVPIVIFCIWLAGPGMGLVTLAAIDAIFPDGATAADVGPALGRPLIYSVIWTTYLLTSKRVKNTYKNDAVPD